MKNEAYKIYYIYNDAVYANSNNIGFESLDGRCIYEVIRVINGKSLFFEEHIERFKKSAYILKHSLTHDKYYFEKLLKKLVDLNETKNINVKLIAGNFKDDKEDIIGCCIKSYYPDEVVYKKGIKTILLDIERDNPNVKSINNKFKKHIKEELEVNNAFEALMVNDEGFITEGSRSNIFFVKGGVVYTSPAKDVLLGVTRKHILKACGKLNLNIIQENIHVNDLDAVDGAFMTGTSVGVLPIAVINDYSFNSVDLDLIAKISQEYSDDVKNYLYGN